MFQFLKWEDVINQENTLLIQYYYNLSDKKDFTSSDPLIIPNPFPPPPRTFDEFRLELNGDIKSERHNLELTHFITPNANIKFIWGLSAQTDIVKAPLYLGTNDQVTHKQFRGFANIEWRINQNNIVNAGALIEKNDFTETELSPRLSLTHIFNKQHSARIGISKAIRSPFIYEAKANLTLSQDLKIGGAPTGLTLLDQRLLGNSNLENQEIVSREIVYFGNFLNSSLLFNARLFHDDIHHFIDTMREDVDPASGDNVPDDPNNIGIPNAKNMSEIFQNPVDSITSGIELELDYHIDPTLRLIASGAFIKIKRGEDNPYISVSAPEHSFSFIVSKRFNEKHNGSLAYYYIDEFKWTDSRGGTLEQRLIDVRLSRNIKVNLANGSLSIVLKNLLGDYSDYQENPSSNTAPKVVNSPMAYMDLRLHF